MPWTHWCPCGAQIQAGAEAPASGGYCPKCRRVFPSAASVMEAGGSAVHLCTRGTRRQRCQEPGCPNDMVALCDETTAGGGTCDRRMCSHHRTRVGTNLDRCPVHARVAKEAG